MPKGIGGSSPSSPTNLSKETWQKWNNCTGLENRRAFNGALLDRTQSSPPIYGSMSESGLRCLPAKEMGLKNGPAGSNPAASAIYGGLAEWLMATVWRTVGALTRAPVGSNPSTSAIFSNF